MGVVPVIYVLGVIVGLIYTDASPLTRLGLALAWPIGPLAFVLVVSLLVAAALYIFPVFGAVVAVGAAAAWWLLS